MRDKKLMVFALVALIILAAALFFFLNQKKESGLDRIEFDSTDINGKTIDSSVFKHYKITMINVWGIFCGPCIEEMPDIQALYEEVKAQNVNVIGIVSDIETPQTAKIIEEAQRITAQAGVTYQNVIPDKTLKANLLVNIRGVPTTIFVDSNGQIVGKVIVGTRTRQQYKSLIGEILKNMK